MRGIIAFLEEMVIVRVELHLKLLVGPHEGIDILHRLLHMHVIVCRTMDDEHITRQVLGTIDQRCLVVASVIYLRPTHVTLGVRTVV